MTTLLQRTETELFTFTNDEQLIDAVSRYLGRYAKKLREQLPTCNRHRVYMNIEVNDLGENSNGEPYTAECQYEGQVISDEGATADEAIANCVEAAQFKGAYFAIHKSVDAFRLNKITTAQAKIEANTMLLPHAEDQAADRLLDELRERQAEAGNAFDRFMGQPEKAIDGLTLATRDLAAIEEREIREEQQDEDRADTDRDDRFEQL